MKTKIKKTKSKGLTFKKFWKKSASRKELKEIRDDLKKALPALRRVKTKKELNQWFAKYKSTLSIILPVPFLAIGSLAVSPAFALVVASALGTGTLSGITTMILKEYYLKKKRLQSNTFPPTKVGGF